LLCSKVVKEDFGPVGALNNAGKIQNILNIYICGIICIAL
jgi:hypothetical protein